MHYPLRDGELFCTLSHCNLMSLSVSILNPPPTTNPTSPKSARLLQPIKDPLKPLKVIFKVPSTSVIHLSVPLTVPPLLSITVTHWVIGLLFELKTQSLTLRY